jgi:hypothetical protein
LLIAQGELQLIVRHDQPTLHLKTEDLPPLLPAIHISRKTAKRQILGSGSPQERRCKPSSSSLLITSRDRYASSNEASPRNISYLAMRGNICLICSFTVRLPV